MKRVYRKMMAVTMLTCMMIVAMPSQMMTVFAGNAKISFSDPSVIVGNEVTVTMKITSTSGDPFGAADVMVAYDASVLEFISGANVSGGAGSLRLLGDIQSTDVTELIFSIKFKALQAGTTKLTVTTQEMYDNNGQLATLDKQGESLVTITPLASYSDNSSLSSLQISPGVLSPAFSAGVTTYEASVANDVTKIVVSAATSDANANMVVSGNNDLKVGDNTVVCKVTSENGQKITNYTIQVRKSETAETLPAGTSVEASAVLGNLKVTIGEQEYAVAASFDAATLPAGFEASSYQYKGNELTVGKGQDLILIYLEDSGGQGGFYVYDELTDVFVPYLNVKATDNYITLLPLEEGVAVPEGFVDSIIDIDSHRIRGWIWETEQDPKYCVFYGMNAKGEKNFYRYDLTEKTIQRYFSDPALGIGASAMDYDTLREEHNSLIKDYNTRFYLIIALILVSVILLATLLTLLLKKGKREEFTENEIPNRIEKPRRKRLSKEEKYLLGEEEREETELEYDYGTMKQELAESIVKETKEGLMQGNPEALHTKQTESSIATTQVEIEDLDDDDDDFEFLDL